MRPVEYGGTDVKLGQAEGHRAFLALAEAWTRAQQLQKEVYNNTIANKRPAMLRIDTSTPALDIATSKSPGIVGWLKTRFSGSYQASEAYLGNKNTYRYNAMSGRWELDADMEEAGCMQSDEESQQVSSSLQPTLAKIQSESRPPKGSSNGGLSETNCLSHSKSFKSLQSSPRYSPDQLEEHGLVLAIQAAHYASKVKRQNSENALYMSSSNLAAVQGLAEQYSMTASEAAEGYTSEAESAPVSSIASKVSSHVFLLVLLIYLLVSSLQVCVLSLLPVWLSSPLRSGGLGYGVQDLALLMSSAAMVVLYVFVLFGSCFEHVLRASPVRALRIGCGALFLSLLTLPIYMRGYTLPIEDILHHHHEHNPHLHHYNAQQTELLGVLGSEMLMLSQLSAVLPSLSSSALIVPAMLIAVIVCSSYLCRKAAGAMLHLSLTASFSSPATIRSALHAFIDILGPFLSCLIFSIIYNTRLRYPLDSSFFLPLSACSVLLAYMSSIFITVQFRGDFGVMADYQDNYSWQTGSSGQAAGQEEGLRSSSNSSRSPRHARQRFAVPSPNSNSDGGSRQRYDDSRTTEKIEATGDKDEHHVLAIPFGDLQLLLSGPGSQIYSYGSKLHNLKDDFKDI
jgi:hypothetical protein